MNEMDWKFGWVTTWDEIKERGFRAWWRRLYESDPDATVFANPDLAWAWIEARGAERFCEPRFLVGRTGGENMAPDRHESTKSRSGPRIFK